MTDQALTPSPLPQGLMTRKPLADIIAEGEGHALGKTLGPVSLTALGIGCIIGAGIFVLTGTAAARYAGPGIMLSFVIGGIACAFVGLCYAELAALLPVAGSTYTYTYATLGEIFAWIIGWDLILEYAMGASTVAVGWSGYIASLLRNFGITIPPQYAAAPWTEVKLPDGTIVGGIVNIPAALIVLALTAMLIGGTKESARLNNIMVAIKLFVVVAFILLGAAYVTSANWHPLIPSNTGEFGHFGWSGVVRGASVVFFAFIGFDAVSTAAQEAKLPQRDMPIGILGSLVICTILYVLVAAVVTGLVPYTELNVPDPIAKAVDRHRHDLVLGVHHQDRRAGGLNDRHPGPCSTGESCVFFTIAKDGLLPKMFSEVHPTLGTPYKSQLLIGIIVAIVAALTPIDVLGEMVSIGTLFAFALVCGAVVYLRKSRPCGDIPGRSARPPLPVGAESRHRILAVADGVPALGDVAAADRLARDRPRPLFRLWALALGADERREALSGVRLQRRAAFLGRLSKERLRILQIGSIEALDEPVAGSAANDRSEGSVHFVNGQPLLAAVG